MKHYNIIPYNIKMTTALCLYGHFRCFDDCWNDLNNYLIKPNNISHVFAQAWVDSMGYFQHPESAANPLSHPGYDLDSNTVNGAWLQQTLAKLNPTQVHLDNYHLHDDRFSKMVEDLKPFHHPSPSHRPKGTLSQVWARSASLSLAQAYQEHIGFSFDRIVCTRYDIGYQHVVDLDTLDPDIISLDGMYGPDVISDAWASGPSSAMSKWSQQFSAINALVANQTMNIGPHEWLRAHFDNLQIPWINRTDVGVWIKR